MLHRRVSLAAFVGISLLLPLASVGAAASFAPSPIANPSSGSAWVEIAPLGVSGAVLVAIGGSDGLAFFEVPADGGLPANAIATFPTTSLRFEPPLTGPRLVVRSPYEAALAYSPSDGVVRLGAFDPYSGEQRFDTTISQAAERAFDPTLVLMGDEYLAAYASTGPAGARTVLVRVDASGSVLSRTAVSAAGALSAALVPALPSPRLSVLGTEGVDLYSVDSSARATLVGRLPVSARAGALWAHAGTLYGLFSTATGVERVQTPLSDPSTVQRTTLSVGASASSIAATTSAEGKLAAALRSGSSTLLLREDALGQYASSTLAEARSSAAGTDAYGLAWAVSLTGSGASTALVGFSSGDRDAVRVAIDGKSTALPADAVELIVTITAVRSPVTVVGLSLNLPPGWSAQVPSLTSSLAPGGSTEATVLVSVPAGAAPGDYAVEAAPAILEASSRFSAVHRVSIGSTPSLSIGAVSGSIDLAPGESTEVLVSVVNRGASATSGQVVVSGPAGLLVSPGTTSVTVPSGGSTTVTLRVVVSSGTPPVEGATLDIELRPDDGTSSTTVSLKAAIKGVFSPALAVDPRDLSAVPGATQALPYAVANTGNIGGLVLVQASVVGLPSSALSTERSYLYVPAFTKVDAALSMRIPTEALSLTRFAVTAALARPGDGATIGSPETLLGTVRALVAVAPPRLTPGAAVSPGGEGTATLTLANEGNSLVTFDLSFAPSETGYSVRVVDGATAGMVVRPFASLEVALAYRAPPLASPGLHTVAITVRSSVTADMLLSLPIEVTPVRGLTLQVLTDPIRLQDPTISTATVTFELSNGGNAEEAVALSFGGRTALSAALHSLAGAVAIDLANFLTVPPYSTLTLEATVALGLAPGEESATLTLQASSSAGLSASTTTTVLRPRADPRVVDVLVVPLRAPGRAGELHTVFANIANEGQGKAVGLTALLSVGGVVLASQRVDDLTPGQARLISFDFVPRAQTTDLAVSLVTADPATDNDAANNAVTATYAAVVNRPAPAPVPPEAVPAAAGSVFLLVLLGLALTEIGKTTFISALFLPLYVKLKPEEVLDQYLRGQIHGYIIANPGEHYNAIKEQLGVTNGALAYHLRVLERAGYIRPQRDGMYKRFYPMGVKIPKRRRLSTFQEAVVKAVRDRPSISQKDLAAVLGVSNQVVNYHVKQLEAAGILKIDRSARSSKLFLGPEAPPAEAEPLAPAAPQPATL